MSNKSLFDRVGSLVEEIGAEKQAAAQEKTGMEDPGGQDGPSSHPSTKADEDEQNATEGSQSADNERIIKESVPDNVDQKPEATEGNAPKVSDTQQGTAGLEGKPTGEDPSSENDYKGKLEGDKKQGDQGGTTHPATGSYGEKYSADAVAAMDDDELLKASADIGNEVVADIANGQFSDPAPAATAVPKTAGASAAATAGEKAAASADNAGAQLDELASGVVQNIVKTAYHQADLVADHVARELKLVKTATPLQEEDPGGRAEEGEAHGTEEGGGGGGGEMPYPEEGGGGGGGAEELLAAMGGGGEPGMEGGGDPMMGGGDPMMGGGDPMMGGEEGGMGGEMGGVPPEMGGMGDEAALQQLASALMELGIDPEMLAAAAAPAGPKIAAAVQGWKRSGKFTFEEAKQGSAERTVRNYMKGYVSELFERSQK